MKCSVCRDYIQYGEEYYDFDGTTVCKNCIYDFLNECNDFDDKYVIGEDVVGDYEIDDYLFEHLMVYEKPDDDWRYEPEYYER